MDNVTTEHSSVSNSNDTEMYFDITFKNIYLALQNFEALVMMFGNLLMILIIVCYKRLHTSSNVLIVSLAVADFITGLSTPFAFEDVFIKR